MEENYPKKPAGLQKEMCTTNTKRRTTILLEDKVDERSALAHIIYEGSLFSCKASWVKKIHWRNVLTVDLDLLEICWVFD